MSVKPLCEPRRLDKHLSLPNHNFPSTASCSDSKNAGETSLSIAPSEKSVQNVHEQQDSQTNTEESRCYKENIKNLLYSSFSSDYTTLKQLITILTNDPGQFENLLDVFKLTIRPYFPYKRPTSDITNLLVHQAVQEERFRHTAVRLCQSVEHDSPIFRGELYDACYSRLILWSDNPQGIILFVSELFTRLNYNNFYGQCLIDAIKELIGAGGDDNIKCICHALMFTGYIFEQYFKESLDEVIEMLIESRPFIVTATAHSLLDSVMELRNADWVYESSSESSSSNTEEECYIEEDQQYDVNTVFYQPDGNQLSTEDQALYDASYQSTYESLVDSSYLDAWFDDEPETDG